jgi:hypothetical protein
MRLRGGDGGVEVLDHDANHQAGLLGLHHRAVGRPGGRLHERVARALRIDLPAEDLGVERVQGVRPRAVPTVGCLIVAAPRVVN